LLPVIQQLEHCENKWLEAWKEVNEVTLNLLREDLEVEGLFEGYVWRELGQLMDKDDLLFVGNSMPIRDLENFFLPEVARPTIIGNR
ncbi:hypothetical protein R0J91_18205, partial [Micrococcus sp. SIMBA_131]